MPHPFERYDYLKLGDLERCPYVAFGFNVSQKEKEKAWEWMKQDDDRMTLIALERYANDLINGVTMTTFELYILLEFLEDAVTHYHKQMIPTEEDKGRECVKLVERDIKLRTEDFRK